MNCESRQAFLTGRLETFFFFFFFYVKIHHEMVKRMMMSYWKTRWPFWLEILSAVFFGALLPSKKVARRMGCGGFCSKLKLTDSDCEVKFCCPQTRTSTTVSRVHYKSIYCNNLRFIPFSSPIQESRSISLFAHSPLSFKHWAWRWVWPPEL